MKFDNQITKQTYYVRNFTIDYNRKNGVSIVDLYNEMVKWCLNHQSSKKYFGLFTVENKFFCFSDIKGMDGVIFHFYFENEHDANWFSLRFSNVV